MVSSRFSIGIATSVFVATLFVMAPGAGRAQDAAAKGEFKNLTVLPASISRKDLTKIMKSWNTALGVKCSACHKDIKKAEDDDSEVKKASREMVKMQDQLNKMLGTIKPEMSVSCYSCHRGAQKVPAKPPVDEAAPAEGGDN